VNIDAVLLKSLIVD